MGLALAAIHCAGQTAKTPEQQRQTALALEQQGKNSEAEAAWYAVLKANPSSPEAYAHLGLLEARQEHYTEAVTLYRKALALGPQIPGLRLNLGLALFKGGEPKKAIKEFTLLLKNAPPSSPEAHHLTTLIGMAYFGLAEYAEAVPYLKDAAAHDGRNPPLLLSLAHSCLWSKQYQCVLDVYHQILALNADSAEADLLAGEALDELKDNAAATEQFRAAVKADPKLPNVHFGLAYLLWTQKRYPEAASEFKAELANVPDHIQAKLYLADSDIQLNRMEDAQPLLETVEGQAPAIPLAHLDLGIIYTEAGRNEDAMRELTAAEKLAPDDVNIHWRLGRLYRLLGNKDQAKAEFDKASTLNKAADDDLHKKIANGNAHPPPAQSPADAPKDK